MKKRRQKASVYLDQVLEVPGGTFGRDATIEINSDREVYIDGCRSVLAYTEEYLLVNIGRTTAKLIGDNLLIQQISPGALMVSGRLRGLEFDC